MKKLVFAIMLVMFVSFSAHAFEYPWPTYPDMNNRDSCTFEQIAVKNPDNLCELVAAVQKHLAQKREAARLAFYYYNTDAEVNSETGANLLKLMITDYLKIPVLPGSDVLNKSVKNVLMGGISWPEEMQHHGLQEMKMIFYRLNGNRCDVNSDPAVAGLFRGSLEKWFSVMFMRAEEITPPDYK